MNKKYLNSLVKELSALPKETEWVEFKQNNENPEEIGEYISALSNSATLNRKPNGYIIWGIDDKTHQVLGSTFHPNITKKGNEELESWLLHLLKPKINFTFYEFKYSNKDIVVCEIQSTYHTPVQFKNIEYIRIGSYKKKLKEYPEKERKLWRIFDDTPFERLPAHYKDDDILNLLDYPAYFDLLELPLPENRAGILERLTEDEIIQEDSSGNKIISQLGAILFAKELKFFSSIKRKAMRLIVYKGKNRIETIREQEGNKGYASGFEGLIQYINTLLPVNEVIGQALRKNIPMFPELALRELITNALIHQDFSVKGTGPTVEIFSDRIEITNPGIPLISPDRFIDSPPKSRNEGIAALMRRIGICEERGSGIDKVIFQCEFYQLPAPLFEVTDEHTKITLFAHKDYAKMDKTDRVRACYQHACLCYVQRDFMTNSSLRKRFAIDDKNSSMVSRIIKDALAEKVIKSVDADNESRRYARYIPFWA